ncbi:hypothetical protein ACSFE6_23480, partial [Pseudomonas baetica]
SLLAKGPVQSTFLLNDTPPSRAGSLPQLEFCQAQAWCLLCFALLCFALLCFALLCFALLCFAFDLDFDLPRRNAEH